MGIELIAVGLRHEPNHSLGILNHMTVTINDRITFKSHNESSYSLFEHLAGLGCQELPPFSGASNDETKYIMCECAS
jgi:hypothetical protein